MNLKAIQHGIPPRLVIFDGVCNFCNASTNFIIRHDPESKFSFTTIQSEAGIRLLSALDIDPKDPNTFVLIKNEEVYLQSSAALEISKELDGAWPKVALLKVVPRFIRDSIYRLVARNRYRILGKRDACMVPTPDTKARFID